MSKKRTYVLVPIHDLPMEAVVTGYARLMDHDGYYTGRNVDENHEFTATPIKDVLKELETVERIRKSQNVFVDRLVFTDLQIFPRAL